MVMFENAFNDEMGYLSCMLWHQSFIVSFNLSVQLLMEISLSIILLSKSFGFIVVSKIVIEFC